MLSWSDIQTYIAWSALLFFVLWISHIVLERYIEWRSDSKDTGASLRLQTESQYIEVPEESGEVKRLVTANVVSESEAEVHSDEDPEKRSVQDDFLNQNPMLLSVFPTRAVKHLLNSLEIVKVRAGDIIFDTGHPRDAFLTVRSGTVSVSVAAHASGTARHGKAYTLTAGHAPVGLLFCVMSAVLPECGLVHSSRATCESEECELLRLPSRALAEVFADEPDVFLYLIRTLALRVQQILLPTLHRVFNLSAELFVSKVASSHLVDPVDIGILEGGGGESSTLFLGVLMGEKEPGSPARRSKSLFGGGRAQVVDIVQRTVQLLELQPGDRMDPECTSVLLSGNMDALAEPSDQLAFEVAAGELMAGLAALTGVAGPVTFRARTRCTVFSISKAGVQEILRVRPELAVRLVASLETRMGSFLHRLDAAVDWKTVDRGRYLCRPGAASDGFYIVLSGRLLTLGDYIDHDAKAAGSQFVGRRGHRVRSIKQTFVRGDMIGERECLTGRPHSRRIVAVRDTELCRLTPSLLGLMVSEFPEALINFAAVISDQRGGGRPQDTGLRGVRPRAPTNICLVAAQNSVPLAYVTSSLLDGFGRANVKVTKVTSSGRELDDALAVRRAVHSLGELEEEFEIVLYEADLETAGVTAWTRLAVAQADLVVVCAWFSGSTLPSAAEKLVPLNTRMELLLLHQEPDKAARLRKPRVRRPEGGNASDPGGEVSGEEEDWSDIEDPIPGSARPTAAPMQDQIKPGIRNFLRHQVRKRAEGGGSRQRATRDFFEPRYPLARCHHVRVGGNSRISLGDWGRVSRLLCNRAVALVLGGGGARGCAHLGVLRTLHEQKIPVDIVAGCSFGALVAGLYAMNDTYDIMEQKFRRLLSEVFSNTRLLRDLTLPSTSYFTGDLLNTCLRNVFAQVHIEDLWLPFLCVSTDIMKFDEHIHREGIIWRAVRASMSLVGFVPPLPHGESILVDGGYTNNFPVEYCVTNGAETVICVDVSSENAPLCVDYGDTVGGFHQYVFARWGCPKRYRAPAAPTMPQIQDRLMYLANSVNELRREGSHVIDLTLRPPVKDIGTLEFSKFDSITASGYEYARKALPQWIAGDSAAAARLKALAQAADEAATKPLFHRPTRMHRERFRKLAASIGELFTGDFRLPFSKKLAKDISFSFGARRSSGPPTLLRPSSLPDLDGELRRRALAANDSSYED